MQGKQLSSDRRAVSIPLTHALTFGITAVLVTALLASAGGFLETQEDRVASEHFGDINSDVVSQLESLDRIGQQSNEPNMTVTPGYPDRVLGDTYTVIVEADEEGTSVQIESSVGQDRLPQQTLNTTAVESGEFESTDPRLCLVNGDIKVGESCDG